MKPETRFKVRLVHKLKNMRIKGLFVRKMEAGAVGGLPDMLIILNGWAIMPELKMPGNNPTPLQMHTIERINQAGGCAFTLYPEQEQDFLDWIKLLEE